MNWVRHGGSTTFETTSSYCRVARQGRYTTAARVGFKRRVTSVLNKSNLIRSIEFGMAVARRLKRALTRTNVSRNIWLALFCLASKYIYLYRPQKIDRAVCPQNKPFTGGLVASEKKKSKLHQRKSAFHPSQLPLQALLLNMPCYRFTY